MTGYWVALTLLAVVLAAPVVYAVSRAALI